MEWKKYLFKKVFKQLYIDVVSIWILFEQVVYYYNGVDIVINVYWFYYFVFNKNNICIKNVSFNN